MAQQNSDKDNDLLLFVGVGFIALLVLAYMAQKPIAYIIVMTSIPIFNGLGRLFNDQVLLDSVVYFKTHYKSFNDLERLGYDDMYTILRLSGEYFRWILLPIIYFGVKMALTDRILGLKRFLDFQSLLREKAMMYPSIRPVVGLNLLDDAFYKKDNPWRLAENPIDLCLSHELITYDKKPLNLKTIQLRKEIPETYHKENASLDKDKTEAIFRKHLGFCLYTSDKEADDIKSVDRDAKNYERLNKKARDRVVSILMRFKPYERGLLAVMLMRALGRAKWQKASYDLLEQMSTSFWIDKDRHKAKNSLKDRAVYMMSLLKRNVFKPTFEASQVNTKGADEQIKQLIHEIDDVKFEILCIYMRSTAWSNVLFIHLLEAARLYGGVLITADFIWLRPIDRQLFYVLNSVGRKTPLVEGAGAYAQLNTESVMGHASVIPDVSEAVLAFETSLKADGWI